MIRWIRLACGVAAVLAAGTLGAADPPPADTDTAAERRAFVKENAEAVAEVERRLGQLHAGLIAYMADHKGRWPQLSIDDIESPEDFQRLWAATLEPYGVDLQTWIWDDAVDRPLPLPPFMVTSFDAEPLTAFRWASQPWVVARIPLRRSAGTFALLPDGRVLILPFDADQIPEAGDDEARRVPPADIPGLLRRFIAPAGDPERAA